MEKIQFCDHNLKLASRHQKNNSKNVSIKFYYFCVKKLKHNFCCQYMTTNDNDNLGKLCSRFYCKNCDYGTYKKSSFNNHIESKKHKNNDLTTNDNKNYAKLCFKKYQN